MKALSSISKFLSGLDVAAFGGGARCAEISPTLRTISSLARVVSSPTATREEVCTAGRLLSRVIERTMRLPGSPTEVARPGRDREASLPLVETRTSASRRSGANSSKSSARLSGRDIWRGVAASVKRSSDIGLPRESTVVNSF